MTRRAIDLTGRRFGRWFVVGRAPGGRAGRTAYWACRCDCGGEKAVNGQSLRKGMSTSCGCRRLEVLTSPERREALREIARRNHERRRRLIEAGLADAYAADYGEVPLRDIEYKRWLGCEAAVADLAAALSSSVQHQPRESSA